MSSPLILGHECDLCINTGTSPTITWTQVDEVMGQVQTSLTKSEIDVQMRSSGGWEQMVSGNKSLEITFTMPLHRADDRRTNFNRFYDAYFSNAPLDVLVLREGIAANKKGVRATVEVMSVTEGQPLNGVSQYEFKLKPTPGVNPTVHTVLVGELPS